MKKFTNFNNNLYLFKSLFSNILRLNNEVFLKLRLLIFAIFIFSIISNEVYADREQDSLALVAFYYATDGTNWHGNTTWLHNVPIDKWYGVTVNGNGRVEEIDLSNYMLSGTITPEIGNLSELKKLNLSKNNLIGGIPKEIGNLTKLSYLNLKGNTISGIPTSISNLTQLKELDLSENTLSAIPIVLSNLTNLEILNLSYNEMKAMYIPDELGNLSNLKVLNLSYSKIEGLVPTTFSNLSKLEVLNISNNYLIIGFGSGIKNLTQLRELDLSRNFIKTRIPKEIEVLKRLEILDLSFNRQVGDIPEGIWQLERLKILNLAKNFLTGEIPSEIKNLKDLELLNLSYNEISGVVPKEISKLTHLEYLYLHNNRFDFFDFSIVGLSYFNSIRDFSYAPQGLIGEIEDVSKQIGESITIKSGDKYLEGNIYKWYRQDNLIENENDSILYIQYLSQKDEGTYTCEVTNAAFPYLVLYRYQYNITIFSPNFYIAETNDEPYQICEGEAIELGHNLEIYKNNEQIQDLSGYTILWKNLDGSEFGDLDTYDDLITNYTSNMLLDNKDTTISCQLIIIDNNSPEIKASLIIYVKILKKPEAEWEEIQAIEYNAIATIKITSREDWIYKFYDTENSQTETTKLTQTDDLEWQTEPLATDISFWVEASREDGACQSDRKEIRIISTSVEDYNIFTQNSINVYPNPASDFINISIDNNEILLTREAQIYDILGFVVTKLEIADGNNRVDISNLARGTYFIRVGDKIEKFVKI